MAATDYTQTVMAAVYDAGFNAGLAGIIAKVRGKNFMKAALVQGSSALIAQMAFVRNLAQGLACWLYNKVSKTPCIELTEENIKKLNTSYTSLLAAVPDAKGVIDFTGKDGMLQWISQQRVIHALVTGIVYTVVQEIIRMFKVGKALEADAPTAGASGTSARSSVIRAALNFLMSGATAYGADKAYDAISDPLTRIRDNKIADYNYW